MMSCIALSTSAAIAASMLLCTDATAQSERSNQAIEAALQLAPDLRHGKQLYQKLCSSCHGRTAGGAPDTVVPALAGQIPLYLIKQMVDLSEGLRPNQTMHRELARTDVTTEQALADIAGYVAKLPRMARPQWGAGTDLAVGKKYYDGLCAFCHGQQGEGNAEHATPMLAHQHYSYLLLQMKDLNQGHRYSVDVAVMDALQALDPQTLRAVADYASRLPGDAPEAKAPAKSDSSR